MNEGSITGAGADESEIDDIPLRDVIYFDKEYRINFTHSIFGCSLDCLRKTHKANYLIAYAMIIFPPFNTGRTYHR